MRIIRAISYGKLINWGRCFTFVRKAGLVAVGERARVTLADEAGLVWAGVADGTGAICFLRKAASPDTPWVDVELRPEKRKWCVAQCYIAGNMPAPEEAEQAAQTLCAALNKSAKRATKKGA